MKNAPLLVFVYSRLDHTEKTLLALQNNYDSADTELYVYCDGPPFNASLAKKAEVKSVRAFVNGLSGFKNITIVESNFNKGLANSIIEGVTHVLTVHESVIVFEDDIESSPETLRYLNRALDNYRDENKIISVTAYSYPDVTLPSAKSLIKDNYFMCRPCSWSWGTWRDRWNEVDWSVTNIQAELTPEILEKFNSTTGPDISRMLNKQLDGKIDSWAVRFTYHAFKTNRFCSYPKQSFTSNIGSDGSGTHKGLNGEFIEHDELCVKNLNNFDDNIKVNKYVIADFFKFVKRRYFVRRILRVLSERVFGR